MTAQPDRPVFSRWQRTGPRTVTLTTGTPEAGLWCGTCPLPSVVRWPVLLLGDDGVSDAGGTLERCTECDPPGDEGTGFRPPSAV